MDLEVDRGPGTPELKRLREMLRLSMTPAARQVAPVKWRSLICSVLLVLSLPGLVLLTQGWPPELRFPSILVWVLVVLAMPGASPFPLLRRASGFSANVELGVLRALEEVDNPYAIGILLEAEGESGGERQIAIHAALIRLLPRAGELDRARLTDSQIERLYTHLDAFAKLSGYTTQPATFAAYPLGGTWERTKVITQDFPELRDEYEAFLVAILKGMESLGTEESVRHIEAIVSREAPSEQVGRIQGAAWQALASIHTRLEAERKGRTLLRPTAEPTELLVRPARSPAESDPESLLRPASEE